MRRQQTLALFFCMSENPSRSNLAAVNHKEGLETVLMTKKTPVTVYTATKFHIENNATIVLSVSDYLCGANIAPLNC